MTHFMRKALAAAAIAASVVGLGSGAVFAADITASGASDATWDRSKVGDIHIHYTEDSKTDNSETAVTGATFTAYRIADVTIYGGTEINRRTSEIPVGSKLRSIIPGIRFDYEEDTADKTELENTQDRALNDYVVHVDTDASDYEDIVLATYDKNPNLTDGFVTSGITDANGNLDLTIPSKNFGAYMVVESAPAEGYTASLPFVCVVPYTSDDGTAWIYTVNAEPKAVPVPKETPTTPAPETPAPVQPANHNTPNKPGKSAGSKGVKVESTWDPTHNVALIVLICVAGGAIAGDLVYMHGRKKRNKAEQ